MVQDTCLGRMRSWVQIPAASPSYVRKSTNIFSILASFFSQWLLYNVPVHVLAKYLQVCRAAGFPVAYDSSKRLAVSAVEFPAVLANLEAKLDALYSQFERLAAANEHLTDMMLGRVANLEEPDSVEVVEGQKKLGDYVR